MLPSIIIFRIKIILLLVVILLTLYTPLIAGPPYDTDDPEPVDFQHWEINSSVHIVSSSTILTGFAPFVEANYGAVPNLQLHVMVPLAIYNQSGGKTYYGFGDTELGAKYRFVQEDSNSLRPQISLYPTIEIPTGNASKQLGNGATQFFIPLWIQKSFGKWTTYGGGGYWINPGVGNKNFGFVGWQAQYQVAKNVTIGGELYYVTSSQVSVDGNNAEAYSVPANQVSTDNEFRFNVGTTIDFTNFSHLLFSIGRSIIGNTVIQSYIGYQMTFGK